MRIEQRHGGQDYNERKGGDDEVARPGEIPRRCGARSALECSRTEGSARMELWMDAPVSLSLPLSLAFVFLLILQFYRRWQETYQS